MAFYYVLFIALFMASLFIVIRRRGRDHVHIPQNWLVVGMLPSLLLNVHRIHDWVTDALRGGSHSLLLKGPWLSGMVIPATCNPDDFHYICKTKASRFPRGSEFTERFDILGDGILNTSGDLWRNRRKIAHKLLHTKEFRGFMEMVTREKVEKVLVPMLKYFAQQGKVVDLQEVLNRFAFDSMCKLVFGVDPSSLSIEFPTVPFARATHEAEEAILLRYVLPNFCWKLLRWLKIGSEKKLAEAWERIDLFINLQISNKRHELMKLVKEKAGDNNQMASGDLLTSYINYQLHNNDAQNLDKSDKFLRDSAANLLVAGKDTTSAALSWFFWLLSKYPRSETKILEELRAISPQSNKGLVVFEPHELEGLFYLHATLCETLRLFPSVPFLPPRSVAEPDVLPSGIEVRPGMSIVFSSYGLGRMEDIWGKDALEFKPERWISDKGILKLDYNKFLVFGVGARSCLGKDLAFMQMMCVAASILFNFHVHVVEGQHVWTKPSVILPMGNGLMVRMMERSV